MSGCRNLLASFRKSHCCTLDAETGAQKFQSGAHISWRVSTPPVNVTLEEKKNQKERDREKRKGKTLLSGQQEEKWWGSPGKQPPPGSPPVQQGSPITLSCRKDTRFVRTCPNSCWWFLLTTLLSLAHAGGGWCCILTDCYTQWKCVIGSLMCSKAPTEGKRGKDGVLLLPAAVASFENLPQPHYHICRGKASRTAWEQDREIMEGKILPQGPGRPCPSGWGDGHPPTAGGRQAAHLQTEGSQQHKG